MGTEVETPKRPNYLCCANCGHTFKASEIIVRTKRNLFISSDKLKKIDIEDIAEYGHFKKGKVYVCPKCHCCHS